MTYSKHAPDLSYFSADNHQSHPIGHPKTLIEHPACCCAGSVIERICCYKYTVLNSVSSSLCFWVEAPNALLYRLVKWDPV